MVMGEDHLPNTTAEEWVTYADHVLVMTAKDVKQIPPSKQEIARGEGTVGRVVTLDLDEVLWSRDGAPKAPPEPWKRESIGYQFKDGKVDELVRMAVEDQPRVEIGFTYIMAIVWEGDPCEKGEGEWRGLGTDSTIPYDGKTIGTGEMEGSGQSAAGAKREVDPKDPNFSLEDEMLGKSAAELAKKLEAAKPVKKEDFGPSRDASRCDD